MTALKNVEAAGLVLVQDQVSEEVRTDARDRAIKVGTDADLVQVRMVADTARVTPPGVKRRKRINHFL
jgi:hypothetical protein